MSARAHPRLVGAFVLGAAALVLASLVAIGSGEWMVTKDRFSLYFPGSVAGLNPGAPVTFRGIKVGEVKEVVGWLTDQPAKPIAIEVVIEVRRDRVRAPGKTASPYANLDTTGLAERLITSGVRARLQGQSLLTGQKIIELDFLPGEPARWGAVTHRYPELPTTPTAFERAGERAEQFFAKLADLPLDQMLEDLRSSLASLRQVLGSPDLERTLAGTGRGAPEIQPTLLELRQGMGEVRVAVTDLRKELTGVSGEGREALHSARQTLDHALTTLSQLDETLRQTDQARVDAARTLDELQRTLRAVRALAEYVQTHPEAVVLGKPAGKGRK